MQAYMINKGLLKIDKPLISGVSRLQMAATMFEPLSFTMELTLESIDHSVKMIANALLRVLA